MAKRRKVRRQRRIQQAPIELMITDISRSGAGVGRDSEGRTIFVPFTATGDIVKVRVTKTKQNYAEAELIELLKASPQRQQPRCPVFTQCGGCQWQHLPYDLQWEIKCQGLSESLRRAGVSTKVKWDEFPAKSVWEYRNRIQIRRKGSRLGFYSNQSHKLIPIQRCDIARPELNQAIAAINDEISAESVNDSDIGKQQYKIELYLTLQGKVDRIMGTSYASQGFRQVNDEQNKNLQSWIRRSVTDVDGVMDLYGGAGNLSLQLAERATQIHCVDLYIDKNNQTYPDNIFFHQMSVLLWLEGRCEKLKYASRTASEPKSWLALLDPPRSGLGGDSEEIVRLLSILNVSTVILVGCKSDTWSRDIANFIAQDWKLENMAMFDFFPQTHHIESAALLVR